MAQTLNLDLEDKYLLTFIHLKFKVKLYFFTKLIVWVGSGDPKPSLSYAATCSGHWGFLSSLYCISLTFVYF